MGDVLKTAALLLTSEVLLANMIMDKTLNFTKIRLRCACMWLHRVMHKKMSVLL